MENNVKHPIAKMYTDKGIVTMELYPEYAPNTVNSFIWAVKENMYVDRLITRIVPGFVVQPTYDFSEEEECDFYIDGEFDVNGFENPIQFDKGIVAMAGNATTDAHGCAFFITLSDEKKDKLQGMFAAFGRVIDGIEEVERLENLPLKDVEGLYFTVKRPVEDEYIRKIEVETFGVEYPKPVIKKWGE